MFTSTYPLMYPLNKSVTWSGVKSLVSEEKIKVFPLNVKGYVPNIIKIFSDANYKSISFSSNPAINAHINIFLKKYFTNFIKLESKFNDAITKKYYGVIYKKYIRYLSEKFSRSLNSSCKVKSLLQTRLFKQSMELIFKEYIRAEEINNSVLSLFNSIKRTQDRNFFIWIHYMEPHYPYLPPPHYLRYKGFEPQEILYEWLKLSCMFNYKPQTITKKDLDYISFLYNLQVEYVDSQIAKLLNELEDLLDDTYIVLTSDHGELLGEHNTLFHGGLLYEDLIHVPLIILGPDIKQGIDIDVPVSHIDIVPTICDLLHMRKTDRFKGKSLLPILNGEDNTIPRKCVISEDAGVGFRIYSCRTKKWKYILSITSSGIKEEFYDIEKDPYEKTNLIEIERADIRDILRTTLINHILREKKSSKEIFVLKQLLEKKFFRQRKC